MMRVSGVGWAASETQAVMPRRIFGSGRFDLLSGYCDLMPATCDVVPRAVRSGGLNGE